MIVPHLAIPHWIVSGMVIAIGPSETTSSHEWLVWIPTAVMIVLMISNLVIVGLDRAKRPRRRWAVERAIQIATAPATASLCLDAEWIAEMARDLCAFVDTGFPVPVKELAAEEPPAAPGSNPPGSESRWPELAKFMAAASERRPASFWKRSAP